VNKPQSNPNLILEHTITRLSERRIAESPDASSFNWPIGHLDVAVPAILLALRNSRRLPAALVLLGLGIVLGIVLPGGKLPRLSAHSLWRSGATRNGSGPLLEHWDGESGDRRDSGFALVPGGNS
jgi:hypothetical protein